MVGVGPEETHLSMLRAQVFTPGLRLMITDAANLNLPAENCNPAN